MYTCFIALLKILQVMIKSKCRNNFLSFLCFKLTCVCICMYMYVYVCVCVYVCVYVYLCVCIYIYIYIYIHIYLNLNPATAEKLTNCFRQKYLFHIVVKSLTRILYRSMSSGDICSNVKLRMTSSCICCLGSLSFDSYILILNT